MALQDANIGQPVRRWEIEPVEVPEDVPSEEPVYAPEEAPVEEPVGVPA